MRLRRNSGPSWVDSFLDRTLLYSFDRSGFQRHQRNFDPEDLEEDLTGRVCIVTGANSGLGREVTMGLARRGATVWMLCRDSDKGKKALEEVRSITANDQVYLAIVDLAERQSVAELAEQFRESHVDVLVHNAGVLTAERERTAEGVERTVATNQVGPFLLTWLLEDRLLRSEDARVIWVSSGGMYGMSLQLSDPEWRVREFDGVRAYAETKRAQVVLNELWTERWSGTRITSSAMHPGWADTPGVRRSLPRFWKRMKKRLRTAAEGADTILWLASCREARPNGLFWFDRTVVSPHLVPWTRETETQKWRLWQLCEELAQVEERKVDVA